MSKSISVDQKRGPGRPATGRDPAASTRLRADILAKVDQFASANDITRSQAIGRLVELGLQAPKPKGREVGGSSERLLRRQRAAVELGHGLQAKRKGK
jgi:hypothetical protein